MKDAESGGNDNKATATRYVCEFEKRSTASDDCQQGALKMGVAKGMCVHFARDRMMTNQDERVEREELGIRTGKIRTKGITGG